jgi:hypothetical protein
MARIRDGLKQTYIVLLVLSDLLSLRAAGCLMCCKKETGQTTTDDEGPQPGGSVFCVVRPFSVERE